MSAGAERAGGAERLRESTHSQPEYTVGKAINDAVAEAVANC